MLDLAAEDSWRAISREFARLFLYFNYPPTQDWFDEGFAQYFSSLRLGDGQSQIGGDPTQNRPWDHDLPGQSSAGCQPAQVIRGIVKPAVDAGSELFMMRRGPSEYPAMFYAQSWIVMHYLLNKNKLSEAGSYFGLVEIKKLPVEQAIQQAFGVTAAEFESGSEGILPLASLAAGAGERQAPDATGCQAYQSLHPVAAGKVGSSGKR